LLHPVPPLAKISYFYLAINSVGIITIAILGTRIKSNPSASTVSVWFQIFVALALYCHGNISFVHCLDKRIMLYDNSKASHLQVLGEDTYSIEFGR
jgi:hypothetical protein